ncbi:hypothetical protein HID58_022009 [Brassica napus]|uniref:Uncharacterized protein n=1 Tax=Brassica napus TaxID=3708 RepID=A0ABQ8CXZ7_BRANA|nr:hypothetical protein HID58_022009 [Brassica napus]
MSAAFHREPQHHLRLDYHRKTIHRFTESHRSSKTPHFLNRDRQPPQCISSRRESIITEISSAID